MSLEDQLLDHLLLEEFLARLDFLTKDERFVIEAALANLPTKEIARELGMTEDMVRGLKSKAKRKIKGREELRVLAICWQSAKMRHFFSGENWLRKKRFRAA